MLMMTSDLTRIAPMARYFCVSIFSGVNDSDRHDAPEYRSVSIFRVTLPTSAYHLTG